VTRAKECIKLFIVELPANCSFAVPKHLNLVAVPLFDLYSGAERYGPIISSLPQCLSRYSFLKLTSKKPEQETEKEEEKEQVDEKEKDDEQEQVTEKEEKETDEKEKELDAMKDDDQSLNE
jgi:Nucleotide hydrolase